MKYRFLTAGAVILTWLFVYLLDLTENGFALLIPLAVLAFFQINEKRMSKYFKRKQ